MEVHATTVNPWLFLFASAILLLLAGLLTPKHWDVPYVKRQRGVVMSAVVAFIMTGGGCGVVLSLVVWDCVFGCVMFVVHVAHTGCLSTPRSSSWLSLSRMRRTKST